MSADAGRASPKKCVLVVGDVMTDVIVRPEGPLMRGADRPAAIRVMPGGSAANLAAWLAFAGVVPILVARVGAADHPRQVESLRAAGVEPVLAADGALPSGMLVSLLSPDGERSFFTDRGANDRLCRADLPDALLDRIDRVHLSGYALSHPGPRAAVLDFLAVAVRRGIAASVDPGSLTLLRDVGADRFLDWTGFASLCVPNSDEAALLAGSDDPERQLAALCRRYHTVVIKRGAAGALAGRAGGAQHCAVPAPAVAAIDTTGAGDAFLAGFLAADLAGAGLEHALRQGCGFGALVASIVGGRPPGAGPGVSRLGTEERLESACKATGLMPS